MKTQEHLQVSAAREENPSWDVTALKAADESRFWREKAFGVRQNVNWELKPSRESKRERAAAASEIYSPPKARFCSDLVRRCQPQIVPERLSLVF